MSNLGSLYRVDNVPWWLRPLFWIVTHLVALAMFTYLKLVYHTCKFEFVNEDTVPKHRILCAWHEFTWTLLTGSHPFQNEVWLNHPDWYMRPIHIVLYWIGVEKLILGSTGQQGRAAADQIVTYLKAGKNTIMMPDGPYGPKYHIYKGVLHLSQQSGVPIVPVRVAATHCWRTREWDRKYMPIPFRGRVRIEYRPAFHVTDPNDPETSARLARELG